MLSRRGLFALAAAILAAQKVGLDRLLETPKKRFTRLMLLRQQKMKPLRQKWGDPRSDRFKSASEMGEMRADFDAVEVEMASLGLKFPFRLTGRGSPNLA